MILPPGFVELRFIIASLRKFVLFFMIRLILIGLPGSFVSISNVISTGKKEGGLSFISEKVLILLPIENPEKIRTKIEIISNI